MAVILSSKGPSRDRSLTLNRVHSLVTDFLSFAADTVWIVYINSPANGPFYDASHLIATEHLLLKQISLSDPLT